jgi:predicted Zn-dependent protease
MPRCRLILAAAILLLSLCVSAFTDDTTKPPVGDARIASADQLYRAGKFAEAEASYQSLLKTYPKLIATQVGLVKVMLREQKIDESLDMVGSALTAQPGSAALLAAKVDVLFRHGEMSAAETSYLRAKAIDP